MIDRSPNPALDPTREWRDDPTAEVELSLLVRHITEDARTMLRLLATARGAAVSATALLTAEPALTCQKVAESVEWIAKISEAFGFVPLVVETDDGYLIPPGAADVVSRVVASAEGSAS